MKRQLGMAKVTHLVSQLPAGRNRLGLRFAHAPFGAIFPTVHPRGDLQLAWFLVNSLNVAESHAH